METEVWGNSGWTWGLPEGVPLSQHWAVQSQECLWGVPGPTWNPKERKQELATWVHLKFSIRCGLGRTSPSSDLFSFLFTHRGDFWPHWADCWGREANTWTGKNKEASGTREMWDPGCFRGSRGTYYDVGQWYYERDPLLQSCENLNSYNIDEEQFDDSYQKS